MSPLLHPVKAPSPVAGGRSHTLDILRGVAVLLVFTRHVNGLPFSSLGWIGVDLFFVLSGFLVSGLLFQEYIELGVVRPGTFLLRRAFKIYPQFYVFLAATVAALLATGQSFAITNFFAEAAFFQNYHQGFWTHTWSLAVEEHFYLLLAAAVAFFTSTRNKLRRYPNVPNTLLAVAALVLILRIVTAIAIRDFRFETHFSPSHLRIDSLLAGVWIAHHYHFNPAFLQRLLDRFRYPLSIASIACLIPAAFLPMDHIFVYTIGLTLNYVAFGILLLMAIFPLKTSRTGRVGIWGRGLAAIGRSSYGIYLWQGPVVFLCEAARAKAGAAGHTVSQISFFLLCLPVVVFIGVLMTKLIEMPFLALREKVVPRRIRGIALESAPVFSK